MNPQSHAITPARTYALVLAALLALTAITVSVSYVQFGSLMVNVVVALAIASVKGSLVALYFMHLRHDKPVNAVIFVCGLLFLAVFLAFCFVDAGTRDVVAPASGKPPAGGPAPARR